MNRPVPQTQPNPQRHLAIGLLCVGLAFLLSACSDNNGNSQSRYTLEEVVDFESYDWNEVSMGDHWEPRAGLRALELDGNFYVLGGRTPRPPMGDVIIPGDSDLWSDVWTSDDQGQTWSQILESGGEDHWAPRAYFQALTLNGWLYVIGGQNYELVDNPLCGPNSPPQCPPFASVSDFFNDVWRSRDGIEWELVNPAAPWAARAGLSVAELNGDIYVLAGSQNDDTAIVGGPPTRIYYNDVWRSRDGGRTWENATADAPWEPRAGAVVVVKGDFMYLLGGEDGFICLPLPDCDPPYFNDVWRSADGANWELVTEAAQWVKRPGHQCGVIQGRFICFGGFGLVENPVDVWVSEDGADWTLMSKPPWQARSSEDIKYDFDIIVSNPNSLDIAPAIFTFGGDRETFDFRDPLNYLRIDDDVWKFSLEP